MLDELLKRFSGVVVAIVVMGSIVDLFQFMWLLKRSVRRLKRMVYNKIKREIIEEKQVKVNAKQRRRFDSCR